MQDLTLFAILLGLLLFCEVFRLIYVNKSHKGVVVGRIDNGCVVKLSFDGELVFVDNDFPIMGDYLKVVHPSCYKLSRNGEPLKKYHRLQGGYISSEGSHEAVLLNRLSMSRWIAKDGDEFIFLELDNDEDYKVGNSVNYKPTEIYLNQFYLV